MIDATTPTARTALPADRAMRLIEYALSLLAVAAALIIGVAR
ncbi:MAG TPA: hypothetical protein VFK38_07575 [Candidatus Limnocylindrales bacterium]|nr:hypothetical protein [Candidatus Limnocylindrales bacterium]